jgi:hypothetical protein
MTSPTAIQALGAALFVVALVHTFSTRFFERLAHARPAHAGIFHLLGEVEVSFGLWAMALVAGMMAIAGPHEAIAYLDERDLTEPMFVFAVMVIAGSRPILALASALTRAIARTLPMPGGMAYYFTALFFVPLLGSFITEPAAMTLAALILRDAYFTRGLSTRLKYATVGVLFVNVSIGGTLTPYAAPPVLMVASAWGWDLPFMLATFGWKVILAAGVNALAVTLLFRRELRRIPASGAGARVSAPWPIVAAHVAFLAGVVAFFLAGLVVLGGQQRWWLEPLLRGMSPSAVYFGATALTAVTDNAALTYLGSLVGGLDDAFKYALVAGAVTGGGLTVIANAPNPAGYSILRGQFDGGAIRPLGLLAAAFPPTCVAILAFHLQKLGGLAMGYIVELYGWMTSLEPAAAFLFLVPFVVAAAGISRYWLETREDEARGAARRPAPHT